MNKKQENKNIIKKLIIIILIIILVTILVFLFQKIYDKLLKEKDFEDSIISFSENNKETIFSIDKIVYFSSCDSKNKSSSLTNFTIENLYAYTDIALFINNNSSENSSENTLKDVKITNIKITKNPILGRPSLYFKSINDFAKSEFNEKNIIQNELSYKVTSEDEVDLKDPILYNNCANPITLSYINQNIKSDYTMIDTKNPITYNGKLLKRCGVAMSSIDASISFDIEIENNKQEKYKTTIYFAIPYEDEEKSIYDGSIVVNKETNFKFYRYE